jgi:hypothetical protein
MANAHHPGPPYMRVSTWAFSAAARSKGVTMRTCQTERRTGTVALRHRKTKQANRQLNRPTANQAIAERNRQKHQSKPN